MKKFFFIFTLTFTHAFNIKPFNRQHLLKNVIGSTIISGASILLNKEIAIADDSYIIEKKANNIKFYGSLDVNSCHELTNAIDESIMENTNIGLLFSIEPPPITLEIQSEGGEVLPTLALVDKITNSNIPIYSVVNGFAASSATLLSVVCKKRFMNKNSFMLLHKISGHMEGKFADIQIEMDNMDKFMNTIKNIYIENSNIKLSDIDDILENDNWIDADECLKLGLIDAII